MHIPQMQYHFSDSFREKIYFSGDQNDWNGSFDSVSIFFKVKQNPEKMRRQISTNSTIDLNRAHKIAVKRLPVGQIYPKPRMNWILMRIIGTVQVGKC